MAPFEPPPASRFPVSPYQNEFANLPPRLLQLDITFHCEAAPNTLPAPAHHFPDFERAVSGAIYRRARAGRRQILVFCRVPLVPKLLQRPGDWAIGRAIGLGVYELIAARVQLARNCALVGFPAKFLIEERD